MAEAQTQNRLSRELDARKATFQRPESWRPRCA
jgi:hypothetical protein